MSEHRWSVHHGDCLEWLRTLPDNSAESMVTDPPAGIGFMGKQFDSDKGGRDKWVAWLAAIMVESMRVLKPGGHAFVWALPRTSHWTATAVEDAGFEIREKHYHLFGASMPKSLDVSKALDAAAGAEREVVGVRSGTGSTAMCGEENGKGFGPSITAPATDAAKHWDGWGTATKPAAEEWILVRKPLQGTVAANVTKWGVGGINVDGCRVGDDGGTQKGTFPNGSTVTAYGNGLNGNCEILKIDAGRWPPSVYLTHSEACRVVGERTVKGDNRGDCSGKRQGGFLDTGSEAGDGEPNARVYGDTTEPVYECAEDCPVRVIGEQSGTSRNGGQNSTSERGGKGICYGEKTPARPTLWSGDTGTAARFFHNFTYAAKPSRAEREAGCDGIEPTDTGVRNNHPTVKGDGLMRILVRLITPPGGLVIDPFTGSGSTGRACMLEGFRFAGCELGEPPGDDRNVQIARARIAHVAGWHCSPHDQPESPGVPQTSLF